MQVESLKLKSYLFFLGGLTVFKRGLEVGLISPQSTSMVAFATIQATDSKSKATDGQPLGDCVEVLINTVFSKTTLLPRSQGNISKLSNPVGRCIQWPQKNVRFVEITISLQSLPIIAAYVKLFF